jgi:hypothetical protein
VLCGQRRSFRYYLPLTHVCRQLQRELLPLVSEKALVLAEHDKLASFASNFFASENHDLAVLPSVFANLEVCTLLLLNEHQKEIYIKLPCLARFLKENPEVKITFVVFWTRRRHCISSSTPSARNPPGRTALLSSLSPLLLFHPELRWMLSIRVKKAEAGALMWADEETREKELDELLLKLGLYEPKSVTDLRSEVTRFVGEKSRSKLVAGSLPILVGQECMENTTLC